ncbi:hypothetical protein LPICM17_300023 [Lactococcus piscium]|nr:hypothetical protein LPICM17_300023 [Lactococcus piscium]
MIYSLINGIIMRSILENSLNTHGILVLYQKGNVG